MESTFLPMQGVLDERALSMPDALAFRFLEDGENRENLITFSSLSHQAKSLAATLVQHGLTGKPVLLLHPPGIDFMVGLFACWHAGAIAVPAYPPRGTRHLQRLQAILSDCDGAFALASPDLPPIPGVEFISRSGERVTEFPEVDPDKPCLLQYTSGSTAAPKGVMISHRNFRSHFRSLDFYQDLGLKSALSWLPPYHDMGLVLKILYALEAGIPLTFFSPEHFVQNPARWLRAISHYRAELSGAPNFAFEMCLRSIRDEEIQGIDLSCWKAAPCGAERVRADTLERFAKRFAPYGFRPETFLPGYGLAETTLIVTASPAGRMPAISHHEPVGKLVSSGVPLPGVELTIVDPSSGITCQERQIGEIRVKAPVVSSGYWNRPAETAKAFGADGVLHTGDLGYLEGGELFVTGRIKDLIIIDGMNHAPEDIESIILSEIPNLAAAAAFPAEVSGREAIIVIAEVDGLPKSERAITCSSIRKAVTNNLAIPIHQTILVRRGLLPRTTSGKIRRSACRDAYEDGSLKFLFSDLSDKEPDESIPDDAILRSVLDGVAEVTGREGARPLDDVISFGMSSIETTRLSAIVESRLGVNLSLAEFFNGRNFLEIANLIATTSPQAPTLPTISRGSGRDANILTHSQERMWYLHQLDPESAAYHVFGSLLMTGPLDVVALEMAISEAIARHEILRSRHGIDQGKPKVWIEDEPSFKIDIRETCDEGAARSTLTSFARKSFRLDSDSPVRVCLVPTGEDRHVLAICCHHIVADGWSLRILARDIASSYATRVERKASPVIPETPGYLDYAVTHRRWIDSGAVDNQIGYWVSRLAGHSGVLPLMTDFPRPNKPSASGGAIEIELRPGTCEMVSNLAKKTRSTPFMVHLSVYLILLRRHGAGDDPLVAVPVANRNHAVSGDLVGTMVNTLPFRLKLDPGESFESLLARVREATFEMHANQDAPFERIIDAVKPERSQDHSPLAQVMFDHQEIPIAETWAENLRCEPYVAHRGSVQFDLSILLTVLHDRQLLGIEYRTDLFRAESASAILDRYLAVLEVVCKEPGIRTGSVTGLTSPDADWLRSVSQGPERPDFPNQTTPGLIARRSAMHPDRIAFEAAGRTVDYATLDRYSHNLALVLRDHGIMPGDRVAVLLERDLTLPISLLAVWKAGASYIPLDPSNPPDRLSLILKDQFPVRILASPTLQSILPSDISPILMEMEMLEVDREGADRVISPDDVAYIIYTSGSTGIPKGVTIPHGALANFLLSMAEMPGITEADRTLAVTTISFDISALEIFLPLITGGRFDLVSTADSRDGGKLMEILDRTKATVMQATPATWRILIEAGWKGGKFLKMLCGGEALDLQLACMLTRMGGQLWNLYGPTETTIWSTLWLVPKEPEFVRIGNPIANTGVHILATDGSPLPPGVTGELWISGAGLANGYWKRPDLNGKSFVNDADPSISRRYHTGDLARLHPNGTLECLGRSDGQVKIRGFRVELGEIENALIQHPGISQAKVALRGSDHVNEKLVAWIICATATPVPPLSEIRSFLSDILPSYMLPAEIGILDSFPLGSSGKVDVSKLELPASRAPAPRKMAISETKLAAIWEELLDRSPILPTDDWFHIGGHSLLALRLFSRIRSDFNRTLPLSTILDQPTLAGLAAVIDGTPEDQPDVQA